MKKTHLEILAHFVFWGLALVVIYIFTGIYLPLNVAVPVIGFRVSLYIFLFYFNARFLIPQLLFNGKQIHYFALITVTLLAIVAFRLSFERTFLMDAFLYVPIYSLKLHLGAALVSSTVVVISSLIFQVGRQQILTERRNQNLLARQREAEIQFLRAQLNPHFLFNMLNNIYSLSITQSPKAPQLILKLSELLRYVTYDSRETRVPLRSEIQFIEVFIDIYHLKSRDVLPVKFEVSGNTDGVEIEPLLLMPLVENAFKHCNFSVENAFLHIFLAVEGNKIVFSTHNSKQEGRDESNRPGGVGLENIRKRLQLLQGSTAALEVEDLGNTFSVTFNCTYHATTD